MKSRVSELIWCGLLCAVLMPAAVHAQGNVCANAIPVVADGRGTGLNSYFINASTTQWFSVEGFANSSYSLEIFDPFDPGMSVPVPIIYVGATFNFTTCAGTLLSPAPTNNGDNQPRVYTSNTAPFAGQRVSFTAPTNDDYIIQITNSGATGFNYTLTASETTLFNPLWSTFGGYQTFYKIYNTTTNQACTVILTLKTDANGTPAGGTNSATIIIPPQNTSATRSTGPSDLNLNPTQAGHAFFTHNCPPGAIQVDGFLGNFSGTNVVLPIKILPARATH